MAARVLMTRVTDMVVRTVGRTARPHPLRITVVITATIRTTDASNAISSVSEKNLKRSVGDSSVSANASNRINHHLVALSPSGVRRDLVRVSRNVRERSGDAAVEICAFQVGWGVFLDSHGYEWGMHPVSSLRQPDWSNPSYWQGRFEAHDTPWDLGRPSTVLLEAVREVESCGVKIDGARVLSPGCGRGSDALELARRGAHVTGVDWSEAAVDALRGGPLRIVHGDMFALPPEQVELVCEHTFFCAIDPSMRPRYVETILRWISPQGFLIGNFFVVPAEYAQTLSGLSLTQEGRGPPFAATEAELTQLFSPHFEIKVLRPAACGEPSRRAGLEWVGVFQKRA